MLTLMTSVLAAALLAQPADSLALSGVVVDPAGKPVPDVEVVLAVRIPADGTLPTLARTMTDDQGAFRLEVARQRLKGIGLFPFIWAYRPGRTVAIRQTDLAGNGASPPVRLTLAEPLRRTVTILDHEGRPVAGVRLVPILHAMNEGRIGQGGIRMDGFTTPDDRLAPMTVVTAADGVARIPYLPMAIDPLTVRVTAPGIVPHDLPLPYRPGSDQFTLKLGRPARLAGSVTNVSSPPAANLSVEVWVENPYYRPVYPGENRKVAGWPTLIRFDSGPVRIQADGSFLTPPQLMTGSSYRIIIRAQGSPLVTSDKLTAATEVTTVPPLRLKQHRKLRGLVHDRQGKPVAGARVFLPSGEPSTATDAQGRFLLDGTIPEKTYLLVKADGFRFQGWPGVPAREPQERELILVRTSEPPDRALASLPAPISMEESRALARRVLEPYLQAALAKGDDNPKWHPLRLAIKVDPGRVLDLLEKHPFQDPGTDASIRARVATQLLTADPKEAESIINAIARPEDRAWAYVWLANALPDSERARKREFIEQATVQIHHAAGGGDEGDRRSRLASLGRIAEAWLNLGEVEKARPLVREGLQLIAALPERERFNVDFLPTAARIEPDRVLSLVRDQTSVARRRSGYAAIALSLAYEHPAEAERVLGLIDDSPRAGFSENRTFIAIRLCRTMARTDPERARRIIRSLNEPQEQAIAWALLALGLAERDKPAARRALAESIDAIDRLVDSARPKKPATPGIGVTTNPAASILPIVERVAPERLEEVFWRAVALMPNDDMARERGIADFRVAHVAMCLARYDRQVADVFLAQAMASESRRASGTVSYPWTVIWAKAAVDPRGAVSMIEALPPGSLDPRDPVNSTRRELITCLVEPIEKHWKVIWDRSGIPLDEPSWIHD